MKQLNYDTRTLIMRNVKTVERPQTPDSFTKAQYRILRNLIVQKKIQKRFFDFILSGLFGLTDWKKLNYQQMYTLIFVLTNYDYNHKKEKV